MNNLKTHIIQKKAYKYASKIKKVVDYSLSIYKDKTYICLGQLHPDILYILKKKYDVKKLKEGYWCFCPLKTYN